jgi:hypothetical protein
MAKVTFYPLGNADCCLIVTDSSKLFTFDFADTYVMQDKGDKRMPLAKNFKDDIGWPDRKDVDVLAITHGDNDHVKGIPDTFWLDHAIKYQGEGRVKIKEMWVPAALIVEEGSEDDTKVVRAEAQHRFLSRKGIRVFARPEHLKDWLEKRGKELSDYRDIITDAGRIVPGVSLDNDGIEFFVHSPFAQRTEDGLLDRNDNCLVMQATIRSGSRDARFLITADSVSENWNRIVNITRAHKNDHRLAWDIFKVPHHCSYLSMSEEKGRYKTKPTPEFVWLLSQGTERSIVVSTSCPIPSETTDLPPHVETYRRYKETTDALDADLVVTMEHPSKANPKRLIINIDGNGPTLKREIVSAVTAVTSTQSPRMG